MHNCSFDRFIKYNDRFREYMHKNLLPSRVHVGAMRIEGYHYNIIPTFRFLFFFKFILTVLMI